MSKPKMEDFSRLNLYVPSDLKDFYRDEGIRMGLNMSSLCNVVLREYMDRKLNERALQTVTKSADGMNTQELVKALSDLSEQFKNLPL